MKVRSRVAVIAMIAAPTVASFADAQQDVYNRSDSGTNLWENNSNRPWYYQGWGSTEVRPDLWPQPTRNNVFFDHNNQLTQDVNTTTWFSLRSLTMKGSASSNRTFNSSGGVGISLSVSYTGESGTGAHTFNSPFAIEGTKVTFTNNSTNLFTAAGTVYVNSNQIEFAGSGNATVSGQLNIGTGGGGFLSKTGAGTLVLSNTSNNYTGTNNNSLNANGTQIGGGTLAIASAGSLGIAPAAAYNNVQFTASGTLRFDGTTTLGSTRNISVASGSTATFDTNGNAVTLDGVVNGSGAMTKAGSGALTLSGTNTYSGATSVTAGSLIVNGTLSSGGGTVTVDSSATIGGSGSISRAVNVGGGANLSPGSASGDKSLAVSSLILNNTSNLNFDLSPTNTTTDGSVNDVVTVNGNFTLDGVLNVTTLGGAFTSATNGTKWRLFDYTGTLTNNTLSLGTMPSLSAGLTWSIDTLTANQVNLTVVPEPLVAAGTGLIAMAMLKRRRMTV